MRQTQLVASRSRTSELEALNRALTELANTAVTLLWYSLYLLYWYDRTNTDAAHPHLPRDVTALYPALSHHTPPPHATTHQTSPQTAPVSVSRSECLFY